MSNQVEAVFDALGEPARGEQAPQGPERAGLIEHRKGGTRDLYSLAPPGMVVAQQWPVSTWELALAAFADAVDEQPKPSRRSASAHGTS